MTARRGPRLQPRRLGARAARPSRSRPGASGRAAAALQAPILPTGPWVPSGPGGGRFFRGCWATVAAPRQRADSDVTASAGPAGARPVHACRRARVHANGEEGDGEDARYGEAKGAMWAGGGARRGRCSPQNAGDSVGTTGIAAQEPGVSSWARSWPEAWGHEKGIGTICLKYQPCGRELESHCRQPPRSLVSACSPGHPSSALLPNVSAALHLVLP